MPWCDEGSEDATRRTSRQRLGFLGSAGSVRRHPHNLAMATRYYHQIVFASGFVAADVGNDAPKLRLGPKSKKWERTRSA
jgi:hypothetical protein